MDEEEDDDDDLPGLEALFADPPADTICGASGRIYRSKTLGVYAVYDEPRRFCIRTVESPFFDPLILLTILCNCITMAWASTARSS